VPLNGGVRVRGTLRADIVQQCVVSFEPVPQQVNEKLDRTFLNGAAFPHDGPAGEYFVDLESDDLPDYFEGPEVDFADYLIETLALALDPYPHAACAKIADVGDVPEAADRSPFSALRELKRKSE